MGGLLCIADFVVNILPLPIVAKLKMPIRQRASIAALLCLGAVATIAGMVREYWVYRALIATTDSTYEALPLWVCADVEIYVALVSHTSTYTKCISLTLYNRYVHVYPPSSPCIPDYNTAAILQALYEGGTRQIRSICKIECRDTI